MSEIERDETTHRNCLLVADIVEWMVITSGGITGFWFLSFGMRLNWKNIWLDNVNLVLWSLFG